MLNVGFSELLLFGIIALVVLGPEKLPVAARTAGRWYAHLRRLISNLQQDIEKELQLSELREHMQQELERIKAIEKQMQTQLDQMHEELAELGATTHHDPIQYSIRQPALQIYAILPTIHQNQFSLKIPYTMAFQNQLFDSKAPVNNMPVVETSA